MRIAILSLSFFNFIIQGASAFVPAPWLLNIGLNVATGVIVNFVTDQIVGAYPPSPLEFSDLYDSSEGETLDFGEAKWSHLTPILDKYPYYCHTCNLEPIFTVLTEQVGYLRIVKYIASQEPGYQTLKKNWRRFPSCNIGARWTATGRCYYMPEFVVVSSIQLGLVTEIYPPIHPDYPKLYKAFGDPLPPPELRLSNETKAMLQNMFGNSTSSKKYNTPFYPRFSPGHPLIDDNGDQQQHNSVSASENGTGNENSIKQGIIGSEPASNSYLNSAEDQDNQMDYSSFDGSPDDASGSSESIGIIDGVCVALFGVISFVVTYTVYVAIKKMRGSRMPESLNQPSYSSKILPIPEGPLASFESGASVRETFV